ncbi:MAG: hypothetical protein B6D68_00560 [spirochete symbiont of Stewartia floridana]|nr:MAG: hypothetical protein B6D68_00560 [spirochete symbiont of Stewartia floridana]
MTDGLLECEDFAAAVRKAGYIPRKDVPTEDESSAMFKAARRRMLIAWVLALPAITLMSIHMSGIHLSWLPLAEAMLGAAAMLGPGRIILKGAWAAITHRHANMDTLVSLGTLAAWTTSLLAIAELPIWSFGAMASMLPAFHLSGRLVEAYLRRRAGADLRELCLTDDGYVNLVTENSVLTLPVKAVSEGALIRIRGGERIPLDGRVTIGKGAVNESMISGEPMPVSKTAGDDVIGGTVLETGHLDVTVTKTGADTFLSKMLRLVEQAQGVQVPLQALADRVSGVFVPAVLGLALITFGSWVLLYDSFLPMLRWASALFVWIPVDAGPWTTGVFAMVSMLVVACPCALGLAAPVAVSVGSGLAARRGLLIKGGEALQMSGELDIIVVDKTGTLTEGKPIVSFSDLSDQDRRRAAALENYSVHPLAHAIAAWAAPDESDTLPPVEDVQEIAGEGISGLVDGISYFIGRVRAEDTMEDTQGTLVAVYRSDKFVGLIVLNDEVRPEAAMAITSLKARAVRPVMATGDGQAAASEIAEKVGIPSEDVRAGLTPEDKLRIVQSYQQQGLRVGMIGDGINDAAALKAADVGFALAHGTDLSMEAGDVVIVKGGLEKIVETLKLSKLMTKKIQGNLIWAFIYNLVALPAAAAAFVHPLMAEAAMSMSSIAVILNSLGMKRHRK